jgi:hypothetical protein
MGDALGYGSGISPPGTKNQKGEMADRDKKKY